MLHDVRSTECSAHETLDAHPQVPDRTHTFSFACYFSPISFGPNNWHIWWLCPHKCSIIRLDLRASRQNDKHEECVMRCETQPDAMSRYKFVTFAYQMLPNGTVRISHCVSGMVFLKTLVSLCTTPWAGNLAFNKVSSMVVLVAVTCWKNRIQ